MNSPNFLEKLAAYVPMPVAHAIYRWPRPLTGPLARRFPATVLYTDISGFTPLSELLSQAGPTGSEELTHLINQYFTRMIRIVQAYHGQVVKFSGDAMTVLFPIEATALEESISMQVAVRRAAECALAMQAKMSHFAHTKTSQGYASLLMKVGISEGRVLECSVGGALERWEYVVGGDPLVQVTTAEHLAQPGQIILSPQAWARAQNFFRATPINDGHGFVTLDKVTDPLAPLPPIILDWRNLNADKQALAEKALMCYIPGAIKARLNEQAEWLAELRRITILFIGVGGFDYEADDAGHRLQNFMQGVQEVTYRYEGSLGKVAIDDKGTVLLILFGAPPLFHEDDSKRAVACALGLQTVARERHLRMAIGITEGSIFAGPVGAPSRREYTVIGNEVNLAARLMEYGRAGSIIIGERVKERAGSQFIIESLGQVSLKGKTELLPAYLVEGEQGVQDEILNRYLLRDDPLVGRKAELEQTRRMASRVRAGQLRLLFIEGEFGLGKSRLAAEMVREWMMEGGAGYGSKCVSYGQQIPYQAWREVLVAIFGLTPSLSTEQKLNHLTTGIAGLPAPPEQPNYWLDRLPLLADVLGLELPENGFERHIPTALHRQNTFDLIEAILRHQAGRHPLLILLEDVQWADELSVALAEHLALKLVDVPLLLSLVYRPGADLSLLTGLNDLPYAHTIFLEPLPPQESRDLIRILLGHRHLSPDVEEVVLNRGQGNPFFLQEIISSILGVIGNHEKQTFDLLEALNLPETVQDVILARIDRLSEDEKLTLKIASVIGIHFQRLLLSEVHPSSDAHYRLPAQLDRLEDEKLLRLEQPAPKWEYVFRNVIAQEVVYEGLLLAQRRQLHAIVAEALENLAPDEVERLAFHFKRGQKWDKALHYLRIASHRARREHANHAAIGHYSEMLACLVNRLGGTGTNTISTDYWDILLERAQLYELIGWRDEELEDLGTLGIMAEALDDDYRRALAARQWARLYETTGDFDTGLELVERAVNLAQKIGDDNLVGQGYNQWGRLLYLRGKYETASDYLQRALAIAQEHHDDNAMADCLNNQGLVAFYQADYETALDSFQRAIDLRRLVGNQVGLGNSLSNLGQVYYAMGRYAAARECYDQALQLHRTIGDRTGEAAARHGLGKIERSLGNFQPARRLFEESLTFFQTVHNHHHEAHLLYDLGFLYCRQEEYNTALIFLEEAVLLLKELHAPWWALIEALIYYSWTLHNVGRFEEAKSYITEAFDIERDTQQKVVMVEDMMLLGRVALSLGELSLADTCAQHVLYFVEHQGILGIEHPAMVYLTCYHILHTNNKHEQAQSILAQGQHYIAAQAAKIDDPLLRQSFLTNIPENRDLQTQLLPQI
jgi:class 3 adenylate cyclase/tetratricopeptide (TPR) repeat protein